MIKRRGISASSGTTDGKPLFGHSIPSGDGRRFGMPGTLARNNHTMEPPKVVYISKAERERLKMEAEEKEKEEAKKRQEELKRQQRELLQRVDSQRDSDRREKRRKENMERQRRDEEKTDRATAKSEGAKQPLHNSDLASLDMLKAPTQELNQRLVENELDQIRKHYLGIKDEKKKIKKPSEKFKITFNFDWDNSEDTSNIDGNPYYQNRPEPQLLFGRGFRAGIDVHEQKRDSNFYDELAKRRQRSDTDRVSSSQPDSRGKYGERSRPEDTHWSAKSHEEMTDRDWRIFREDFDIYIKGSRVPPPMRDWSEAKLPQEILKAVKKAGFKTPTAIQMQAVPIGLEMRDLIGIAATGSGKTVAFVLPMLTYVNSLPPLNEETTQDGPYALVLAPTRELAQQIHQETVKFAAFCKIRAVLVVGGHSVEQQGFELRNGAEIVIGTPGRLKDCLDRSYTVLSQCNYVILDEADRMIDMGFEDIVNEILDCIPTSNLKDEDEDIALQQELSAKAGYRRYRITQMFSATMAPAIEKLTKKYLRNPVHVSIGDVGSGKKSITQLLEFVSESRKKQKLQDILLGLEGPIIVFVNMKKVADVVARHISNMEFRAIALHGGKNQDIREGALESFKSGEYDILVATDVVGRGLDVKGVKAVINYDMPKDIQTYTHRIGRTGRAGAKGLAISLVTEEDSHLFYDLKQQLVSTGNNVPSELEQHPATSVKPAAQAKATTD